MRKNSRFRDVVAGDTGENVYRHCTFAFCEEFPVLRRGLKQLYIFAAWIGVDPAPVADVGHATMLAVCGTIRFLAVAAR